MIGHLRQIVKKARACSARFNKAQTPELTKLTYSLTLNVGNTCTSVTQALRDRVAATASQNVVVN